MEQEGCILLYKAQELARERGLDVGLLACGLLPYCEGKTCTILERYKALIDADWKEKQDERKRKITNR